MSSASGSGSKGDKDKQKGTYATLKIPNLYQGSSASSAKPSGKLEDLASIACFEQMVMIPITEYVCSENGLL